MDRRTWMRRTGAAFLGVVCAPMTSLADWHAAHWFSPHFWLSRRTLFVNSSPQGRGGPGTSWETAFASLQDAMNAISSSSSGTTIIIGPNHAEYTIDVIDTPDHEVRIIGLGDDSKRPRFDISR